MVSNICALDIPNDLDISTLKLSSKASLSNIVFILLSTLACSVTVSLNILIIPCTSPALICPLGILDFNNVSNFLNIPVDSFEDDGSYDVVDFEYPADVSWVWNSESLNRSLILTSLPLESFSTME